MRHICVIGLSWGDEGKGKVVDVLTGGVDAVVRYQGGANAGHTICFGDKRHVLHHLPAGILHEGTQAILGNGMVIAPGKLLEEVSELPDEALERLHISERAHLVLPHHILLDRSRESGRKAKIGTTLRGIGPAYQEKYARTGVRLGDLLAPGFIEEGLRGHLAGGLEGLGAPPTAVDEAHDLCRRFAERLGARVGDTAGLLARLHRRGDRFLFEGAQGSLLDIDFGTYPYVTSSSSSFLGIGPGSGFSPRRVDHVLGVSKAYCTRVGEGPFPTELDGEEAERLRAAGEEYGATTGRPRRCGWLDLPALRYALEINDVDSLALTKADVLCGRDAVPVAVGYRLDGKELEGLPVQADALRRIEPIYEEWPGWSEVSRKAMAPFVTRLEERLGRPVSIISTGRRRSEVILSEPFSSYLEVSR